MSQPHRLKTAGITVNVRQDGAGKPLLFLGGSGFDLSIRAPVFDSDLTQKFAVAAADPRGLGKTDQPAGEWSMQDYAQDALDLINALGWNQVNVLGESFGAMVALHLAVKAPGRIKRLALAAGSPGGSGGKSYPIEDHQQIKDPHQRSRKALEIMDCRFAESGQMSPEKAAEMIDRRVASEVAFLAANNNAQGFPRLLRARAEHDAWADLSGIEAPTLVFAGRYDRQAPPDRAENIVKAMPNATLHMVDGGHSLCFATPEPVATLLRNWT